ncbi:MAG: hypothetical protein AAFR22_10395, partial [Chloroflexota bacterium]
MGLLWLGWSVARPIAMTAAAIAGWFTALPYALSPRIIDVSALAIPDSLIPLACVLALLGAARAITRESAAWLVVSLAGAIAAIYLKYSLLVALWPTFCAVVYLLRVRGWRKLLPWVGVLAVISAVTAGYLVFGYGALSLENQEAEGFRETGLRNMFDIDRNLTNLSVAVDISTGTVLFFVVLIAGVGAYVLARRGKQPTVQLNWLWVLLPYIAGNALLTSSVVYANLERGGYGRIRFMFPAALAVCLIFALCVVQVILFVRSVGATRRVAHRTQSAARYAPTAIVTLLSLVIAVPAVAGNITQIRHYALPDTNLLLWQWSDASIPPDGLIHTPRPSRTHLVWNRPYSGYTGSTPFAWEHQLDPATATPSEANAAGIAYVVVTEQDLQQLYNGEAEREFINDLWPLKTIPANEVTTTGETTHIYRVLPPQTPTDIHYGERIRLIGYDLRTDGSTITLRPYWQATATPHANYSMFVHVYPAGEPTDIIAQWDGTPVTRQRLPQTWDDPDERLIGADVLLTLPDDAPDADIVLAVGLYNFESGARLPVGESDRYEIR